MESKEIEIEASQTGLSASGADNNACASPRAAYEPASSGCPCSVSIYIIVALSGILIIVISLLGGLLLYGEAVSALEKSAKESSKSHAENVAGQVRTLFQGTETSVDVLRHFNENHTFMQNSADPAIVAEGTNQFNWAYVEPSAYLYGMASAFISRSSEQYRRTATWWDPLATGVRDWTVGMYYPGLTVDGVPAYTEENGPKIQAWSIDAKTAVKKSFSYSYSAGVPDFDTAMDNANKGLRVWSGPDYWVSTDDTSYLYMTYRMFAPPTIHHPDGVQDLNGFFISETWQGMMAEVRRLDESVHMAVVDLGSKERGKIVFAHTLYSGTTLKKGCARNSGNCVGCNPGAHPCMRMIEYLGETVTAAGEAMAVEPYDAFVRKGLPGSRVVFDTSELGLDGVPPHVEVMQGGDYFLRKVQVWKYGDVDFCAYGNQTCADDYTAIDLLWMKPTSVLDSDVNDAWTLMIIFVVIQCVVVALMVMIKLVWVASPLNTLIDASALVEAMDITGARFITSTARRGVSEVDKLAKAFDQQLKALKEYRSFLPANVLAQEENDDEDDGDSTTKRSRTEGASTRGSTHNTTVTEAKRIAADKERFQLVLKPKRVCMAVITPSAIAKDATVSATFNGLIESIDKVVRTSKGYLQLFNSYAVCTWNSASNTAQPATLAVGAVVQLRDEWKNKSGIWTPLHIGLEDGKSMCGNVGTEFQRIFTVMETETSTMGRLASLLSKFSKRMSPGDSFITTDHRVNTEAKTFVAMRQIENVTLDRDTGCAGARTQKLWEAVKKREDGENDEWMYSLEGMGNEKSMINSFNKAWLTLTAPGCTTEEAEKATEEIVNAALGEGFDLEKDMPYKRILQLKKGVMSGVLTPTVSLRAFHSVPIVEGADHSPKEDELTPVAVTDM